MFTVHTTLDELKRATLNLCLGKPLSGKSRDYCDVIVLNKALFSKCLSSTPKQKAGIFKFHLFEGCFQKALFSRRISVDGRPNHRYKPPFFKFLLRSDVEEALIVQECWIRLSACSKLISKLATRAIFEGLFIPVSKSVFGIFG